MLGTLDVDLARGMHFDIAVLEPHIGAGAGEQDLLGGTDFHAVLGGGHAQGLLGGQGHRVTLGLHLDLALGGEQLDPGALDKQRQAFGKRADQATPGGQVDVLAAGHRQRLALGEMGRLRGAHGDAGG